MKLKWYVRIYSIFVGLPIPVVLTSVILSYDKYGIKSDNGETILWVQYLSSMYASK